MSNFTEICDFHRYFFDFDNFQQWRIQEFFEGGGRIRQKNFRPKGGGGGIRSQGFGSI